MIRILMTAGAACLIGHAAFAHAHLQGSSPAADSTVTPAPQEVTITFSEAVEPRFSTIQVIGADGKRIDQGEPHLVGGDGKRLGVAVASLPPGAYTVVWHATAVDTHKTEGTYQFTVAPANASGITLEHVWARATAGAATTGAAYLTVSDSGQPDRLVGVSTPVAGTAEVHETIDDHGVMKMRAVDGIDLVPGKPVTFKPGGYHIMLMGLKNPLKTGDSFPLTLTFEHAQPITVSVKVEATGAGGMAHDHASMRGMVGLGGMHDHMGHTQ
jgi:copper(I)-binding protein